MLWEDLAVKVAFEQRYEEVNLRKFKVRRVQLEGTVSSRARGKGTLGIFQEKQRHHFTETGKTGKEANLWGRKSRVQLWM